MGLLAADSEEEKEVVDDVILLYLVRNRTAASLIFGRDQGFFSIEKNIFDARVNFFFRVEEGNDCQ